METIVKALADAFGAVTAGIASAAVVFAWAILAAAAVAGVAMTVDLLAPPARRFIAADSAARPGDGILIIGQFMAIAALGGGVVLWFSDTASRWQPLAAFLGGAVLLTLILAYRRSDDDRQARMVRVLWLAPAFAVVVATFLAYVQRSGSAIVYLTLLGLTLAGDPSLVRAQPTRGSFRAFQDGGRNRVPD